MIVFGASCLVSQIAEPQPAGDIFQAKYMLIQNTITSYIINENNCYYNDQAIIFKHTLNIKFRDWSDTYFLYHNAVEFLNLKGLHYLIKIRSDRNEAANHTYINVLTRIVSRF